MEDVAVALGDRVAAGAVDISKLSERIDVYRLGLGEVRFFVKGYMRNHSDSPAFVTLSAVPNNSADGQPEMIGTVTLQAGEALELTNPSDMDQGSETIHENLAAVFGALGEGYVINPIVEVQGANQGEVIVDWIQLSALPAYWRTGILSPGGLTSYEKNVKRIYQAMLEGSVKNRGDQLAEVTVYISPKGATDMEESIIAHAFLEPDEKLQGYEMLVEGGATRIKEAFEKMVSGEDMHFDFVVVSEQPLAVKSRNLRIQAKLTVEANIF